MPISDPKRSFGIDSIVIVNRTTGIPKYMLRVLESGSFDFSMEKAELSGGSQLDMWAVENGFRSAIIKAKVNELPNELLEDLLLGVTTSTAASATTGTVGTAVNKNGTSAVDATTGMASVTAESGEETSLKSNKYLIEAATTTAVDVYSYVQVEHTLGTNLTYENDLLKVTAAPLTVPDTGGTVSIPGTGLEITGGSGTVLFTVGDTAIVETYPLHNGVKSTLIGSKGQKFTEVGLILVPEKTSDNQVRFIEIFRALPTSGFEMPFDAKEHGSYDIEFTPLYDSSENGIAKMHWVDGVN